jgi:hypothetical protein
LLTFFPGDFRVANTLTAGSEVVTDENKETLMALLLKGSNSRIHYHLKIARK